jgi:hypothetical protein
VRPLMNRDLARRAAALLAAIGMALPTPAGAQAPAGTQSSGAPPRPAAAATPTPPRTAAGTPAQELDGGWPRDYATPTGAALRVFQPQVGSWDGQKHMVAFAAVS